MKAEPILQELERVKEALDAQVEGDLSRFVEQMELWVDEHPHNGPVLSSPEELQQRLRSLQASAPPQPASEPYRVYDPIIAEVHRIRDRLDRERRGSEIILEDEIPRKERD